MRRFIYELKVFTSVLVCVIGLYPAGNAAAMPISGFGVPSDHSDLAGGEVIDFEFNSSGDSADSFGFGSVTMTGNNVLRITDSFSGTFNVSGNSLALTTNDLTQEVAFDFLSPVDAFGFNFGGADLEWRLVAYSSTNAVLDELIISPFGNSNNGEWFGLSLAGIASARLFNTEFDTASNSGATDYVVLDNFTYVKSVPEPATLALFSVGLGVFQFTKKIGFKDERSL
ncbi:MAG: PEP-CTERM sorting domain-containing protein [Gammaproteobacteria bacterium]